MTNRCSQTAVQQLKCRTTDKVVFVKPKGCLNAVRHLKCRTTDKMVFVKPKEYLTSIYHMGSFDSPLFDIYNVVPQIKWFL